MAAFYNEVGDTLDILNNESVMDESESNLDKHDGGVSNASNESIPSLESLKYLIEIKCNGKIKSEHVETEEKLGHRRVNANGVVSYKKIETSTIMNSIQLGIQNSVGKLSDYPERDILMKDFMTVESTSFISEDSCLEPTHHSSQFIFKTYAPMAFRHFRDLFGIKQDNFVSSFCSTPLLELPNPGASGSVFYLTENDEFVTKTVQRKEALFLQKLLPGYYLNLNQNPCTLLPKFFGFYCYKCDSKNVRLVVMNNLLPSSLKMHQKYDLKGSTHNRKASETEIRKSCPTYKDLDFLSHHPEGFFVEDDVHKMLLQTIQRDCRVLESFQIIDYSLLVGVHNLDEAKREKIQRVDLCSYEEESSNKPFGDGSLNNLAHENCLGDLRVASCMQTESVLSNQRPSKNVEGKLCGNCGIRGLPARQANGETLLLFIGIIDILQSYRIKKKLEHAFKSIIHDGDTISVHNPQFYAKRFQEFLTNTVFKSTLLSPKTKRKGTSRLRGKVD